MNLNPKPKPIRYRVSSGGVEHASLDSLCSHFCWHDVKDLIRLKRIQGWLSKIDREDIAKSIDVAWDNNAPDWSVAALFFGLDETSVDGWESLAKYWYNQRLEATIDLNLEEWGNSDLKYEQLKMLLPPTLLTKMGEYQYISVRSLSPNKQKKALERLAAMGSSSAKQRLAELKDEAARETERKKKEAKEDAKRFSIDGLRKDWVNETVCEVESYDSSLQPVASFLFRVQQLLLYTSGSIVSIESLANCIDELEKEAINSPYKEYYWCVILATYRYLNFSDADKVVNSISNKVPGGVTFSFERDRDFTKIVNKSSLFIGRYPSLRVKLSLWNHAKSQEIHTYSFFSGFIHEIGIDLLNKHTSALV